MGNEQTLPRQGVKERSRPRITIEGDGSGVLQTTQPSGDVSAEIDPSFRDIYRLRSRIGQGSHSQVFMAEERATNIRVAVKAVHTDWLDRRRLEFLHAEIDIHREVSSHPYIVRLLGVFDDPEATFIVEELAHGGSLLEHLHSRSVMSSEAEVRLLMRRLLTTAKYLHNRGIVHRDIKPENLLVMEEGVMNTAKLADFGFALRVNGHNAVGPACGTPEYVAPEILLRQPFDGRADIWSAGVTAFCLLSGTLPFRGLTLDKLYTAIMDGDCSYEGRDWETVSFAGINFVQCMLRVDLGDRWTAADLLEHPWMTGRSSIASEGSRLRTLASGGRRRTSQLHAVFWVVIMVKRLERLAALTRGMRKLTKGLELGSP